jgi:hypothetical protein
VYALQANDGLIDQPFAKNESLVRPLEAFFDDVARIASC